MSIFGRRPDHEAVATQLIEGLENGTLTLDDPPVSSPDNPTATVAQGTMPTSAETCAGAEGQQQVEPKGDTNAPVPPKPGLTVGGS